MPEYTCIVNQAGAAADGGEGPEPVIYINLTDNAGSFTNAWFFAADAPKKEILEVAISAMRLFTTVGGSYRRLRAGRAHFASLSTLRGAPHEHRYR